jgi:hypothetical protein
MSIETVLVTNLREFAAALEAKKLDDLIFRGQALIEWPLMPTAFRRDVIKSANAEERLRSEIRMLNEFKRQARPYLSDRPDASNEWEWLALAQHNGLPTRFMDWTENAAAALFFAVEYPNDGKASAVWCTTRPSEKKHPSPFEVDGIYFYEPPHILARITVQQACFTVHPTNYDVDPFEWPGESFRMEIPSASRVPIRKALRSLGIHRASLFPDAAGIAAELRRRFRAEQDEP